MDKTTVFEIIAGSWASVTILLVLGFLNAMRQDVLKLGSDLNKKIEKIELRLTKLDDRIYSLNVTNKGGRYGDRQRTEKGC